MKIIYFHQHFSTPDGSTGTRSYEMARSLVSRGHEVTMVCGSGFMSRTGLDAEPENGVRTGVVDGISVIELSMKYSNYDSLLKRAIIFMAFAIKSIAVAWRTDYDLLFATSTPLTAGIPGVFMRLLKPRAKFVFEVRDLWPELPRAMGVVRNPIVLGGMSLLERLSYLSMHAGVALSPGIKQGMVARSPTGKSIAMIPNGSDLDMFGSTRHGDRQSEPLVIEPPDDGFLCVFTGAHGLANGLDAVLNVAGELKARGRRDIYFLFIGDGKQKPYLQKRAESEKLSSCLFYPPVPKTELVKIMKHVDVGLMILDNVPAFYYGTSPNKFFDYIAAGLPVVNNYPGWLATMIEENSCGKAVAPGDTVGFADTLVELADNPALCNRMGKHSRQLAKRDFDRQVLVKEFSEFLENLLPEGRLQ